MNEVKKKEIEFINEVIGDIELAKDFVDNTNMSAKIFASFLETAINVAIYTDEKDYVKTLRQLISDFVRKNANVVSDIKYRRR